MSRFKILADELNLDPLLRGYSGMTDAEAAEDIDMGREDPADAYRLQNQPIGTADLEFAIRESLKWSEYRERQEARSPDGITFTNPAMSEFMDIFFTSSSSGAPGGGGQIDLQGSYMDGLIDRMVAEGSMGTAVADQLRNYGLVPVSRGQELGVGAVTEGDVKQARTI